MKTYAFIISINLLVLLSCNNANNKKAADIQDDTISVKTDDDTISVKTDSVVIRNKLGDFVYVAEIPSNNEQLHRLVCEWISEQLGGYYQGSYSEITPVLRIAVDSAVAEAKEYAKEFEKEEGRDAPASSSSCFSFRKAAEGQDYATWTNDGYKYLAASAHGIMPYNGQTFRKSDGRRIGWEVLRNTDSDGFQKLLRDGLKQYLEIKSDSELKDCLMDVDINSIPLPKCQPLFTSKGISFVYNQYEIMPYAVGLPTFTIGYDKLDAYLTATARNLVSPKSR